MKRVLLTVLILCLLASFPVAYAGKSPAAVLPNHAAVADDTAPQENPIDSVSILASDETAGAFLQGYWTNGRADYIYASVGDSALIQWQTNLPYPSCHLYVLENGILLGKNLNEKGNVEDYPIFSIEITDENTLKVYSFYREEETVFVRDDAAADPSNLSDDYVFWTIDRAMVYLEGEWMTSDLNFFTFGTEDGFYLNTDLPCPEGSGMGFCDLELCSYTMDDVGRKTFEPAYRFHIVGRDTMLVHCYSDDGDYEFVRISGEVDESNLDPEYVFFCDARANRFLLGKWQEQGGDNQFTLLETGGLYGWKTSLPVGEHADYIFARKGLLGLNADEDGNLITEQVFTFDILSRDEIVIHVVSDGSSHTMIRTAQ